MDYLKQKVSYLQGLADGLGIDESTKEGKLLLLIVEVLEDFADVLDETIENQMELEEYVNFIDEDLADVEDEIYDSDEDYDDEFFDDFQDDDFEFEEFDDCCDEDCCGEEDCCCDCEDEEE
ncbi:MAG: CD1247 N-terminal domain-containing protein [Tissierellaceae bacterium]